LVERAPTAPIVASDINAAYVAMAKKSALDARVEKYMTFNTGRFQAPARS
jgi:23S rRNA G2445 N2-methylase RlmL